VSYRDFGLRWDQAEWAAVQLEMTATCVLAGAIRDVIVESKTRNGTATAT